VIQSFADDSAVDLFRERNTRAARRIPKDLWRVVQRKLKLVDAAGRLEDLVVRAGNRLERLKGDQAGRHSVRVNMGPASSAAAPERRRPKCRFAVPVCTW
jgi:proteic killer suppression protein